MRRVVIAEDSIRWRMELKDILLSHGYSVVGETTDGRTAIELYLRLRPDLIILDARMPEMDGATAIKELRRKDPDVVAVISAGSGEKDCVLEALSAGAVDFITKPFAERRVVNTLRRVMMGIGTR